MEYLAHHGILGQKWGVRRFQNEDGTRTAAGLRREHNDRVNNESKKSNNTRLKTGLKIAGAALATGAVLYAAHKTGVDQKALNALKKTTDSILKNNSKTPVSKVKKEPSEAVKSILNANKDYKVKSKASKSSDKIKDTGRIKNNRAAKSISNLNRDAQNFMNFTDQLINQFA